MFEHCFHLNSKNVETCYNFSKRNLINNTSSAKLKTTLCETGNFRVLSGSRGLKQLL